MSIAFYLGKFFLYSIFFSPCDLSVEMFVANYEVIMEIN